WQAVAWQATTVPSPASAAKADAQPTTAKPATLVSAPAASGERLYQKGSRGGCFYLNSKGNKVYVDRKLCG
ncbi:MAG: hypothetical protein AB7J13_14275, partial [Pyrinomonadaceae bacterium]